MKVIIGTVTLGKDRYLKASDVVAMLKAFESIYPSISTRVLVEIMKEAKVNG